VRLTWKTGRVTSQDFETLAGLHDLTPDLYPNRGGLASCGLYYRVIEGLDALAGSRIPAIAAWSNRERGILRPLRRCPGGSPPPGQS